MPADKDMTIVTDPNTYRVFKVADTTIADNLQYELDQLSTSEEEGLLVLFDMQLVLKPPAAPVALVGALVKALCCSYAPPTVVAFFTGW